MASLGKITQGLVKERNKIDVDSGPGVFVAREEVAPEQLTADSIITNLALTKDKNARVMDVSAAIAEEQTDVYIRVPPATEDPSQDTYAVRNSLVHQYRGESENGTIIRFDLFKKIVDNAILRQTKVMEAIIQPLAEPGADVDTTNMGDLYAVLNGSKRVDQFVSNSTSENSKKSDQKTLWITLGVAFLSLELMQKLSKLKWMGGDGKEALSEEALQAAADAAVGTPAEKAAKLAYRKAKIIRIISKIAEAVVLFALIHNLSKKQAQVLADTVLPPSVDPGIKEEFTKLVETLYDNPPADISAMILGVDNGDELIIEYCMARINAEKEQKRFNPWLVYAIAKIRDLNITDVARSLSGTSNEADRIQRLVVEKQLDTTYRAPTFSQSEQIIKDSMGNNIYPFANASNDIEPVKQLAGNTRLEIPIAKYLPDGLAGGQQSVGFDIANYMGPVNAYSETASLTSDFYLNLMQNNKYTPELVCCLLKFLGDDLDFLKNLRNTLKVFQKGIGFRLGDLLQDIVNGLFTDLRARILTYAITELAKLMAKAKKPILAWIERTSREDKYLAFCTPLLDMAYAILGILNEFEDLMKGMLKEILEALLTFELKIDDGTIKLNGTNRYVNIIGILDSIIFALEHGRLCNQSALRPEDIHPDAIPVISSLSAPPSPHVSKAMDAHEAFSKAIYESVSQERQNMITVKTFQDPEDAQARGAVSLTRRDTGQTIMEVIAEYSPRCGAFSNNSQFNRMGF